MVLLGIEQIRDVPHAKLDKSSFFTNITIMYFVLMQVKLERVLGLTVSSNASLATAPTTGSNSFITTA